jgi:hypothetical protein
MYALELEVGTYCVCSAAGWSFGSVVAAQWESNLSASSEDDPGSAL